MRTLFLLLSLACACWAQNPNTAVYPTGTAADSDLFVATNDATTILNGAINNAVTSIVLNSGSLFVAPVIITIDSEIIHCTTLTSNTLSGCTRGAQGTTAAAHTSGSNVNAYMTAWHFNQAAAEIKAIEANAVKINGSNTYGASAINDATAASRTAPNKAGTTAAIPATCTVGDTYFSTSATPGRNMYYCTATNTWTQQASGGGDKAVYNYLGLINSPQTNTLSSFTDATGYNKTVVFAETGPMAGAYAKTYLVL